MSTLTHTDKCSVSLHSFNLKNRRIHREVKKILRKIQYEKCAYCECKLNGDFGHIEHYRPTNGYRRCIGGVLIKPGYTRLKNDPANLLLSCSRCNCVFKRNHFALAYEGSRDTEGRNLSREKPLLISPAHDEPERYLAYNKLLLSDKTQ